MPDGIERGTKGELKKPLLLPTAALIGISTNQAQLHDIEIGYNPWGVAFLLYKKIQRIFAPSK